MSKIFPLAGLVVAFGIAGVSAEEGFKYDSKSRRDPFVPLISETGGYASDAYEASAAEDIRLEGIVWDEGKGSIAIINGEIVKEGELIGSIKILKINKESVTFDINGEHINMELNKE
jgi:hypothetical protein